MDQLDTIALVYRALNFYRLPLHWLTNQRIKTFIKGGNSTKGGNQSGIRNLELMPVYTTFVVIMVPTRRLTQLF